MYFLGFACGEGGSPGRSVARGGLCGGDGRRRADLLGSPIRLTPLFFVQGQGGTPIRQAVLFFSAVVLFGTVAWQMVHNFQRQAGDFYRWYGLGPAAGCHGVDRRVPADGPGGRPRLGQSSHAISRSRRLPVTALAAAREAGARGSCRSRRWRGVAKGELLPTLRKEPVALLAVAVRRRVAGSGSGIRTAASHYGVGRPWAADVCHSLPGGHAGRVAIGVRTGGMATAVAIVVADVGVLRRGHFTVASPVGACRLFFGCMGLLMSTLAEVYRRNRVKVAAYEGEEALPKRAAKRSFWPICWKLPSNRLPLAIRTVGWAC